MERLVTQALATRAYEASQDAPGAVVATTVGGTTAGTHSQGTLSADHELLCQIGNCLQLDEVSMEEWTWSAGRIHPVDKVKNSGVPAESDAVIGE